MVAGAKGPSLGVPRILVSGDVEGPMSFLGQHGCLKGQPLGPNRALGLGGAGTQQNHAGGKREGTPPPESGLDHWVTMQKARDHDGAEMRDRPGYAPGPEAQPEKAAPKAPSAARGKAESSRDGSRLGPGCQEADQERGARRPPPRAGHVCAHSHPPHSLHPRPPVCQRARGREALEGGGKLIPAPQRHRGGTSNVRHQPGEKSQATCPCEKEERERPTAHGPGPPSLLGLGCSLGPVCTSGQTHGQLLLREGLGAQFRPESGVSWVTCVAREQTGHTAYPSAHTGRSDDSL